MKAWQLQAGDVILYRHGGKDHRVTILRKPEPHTDVTGLPVLRMWAKRVRKEGWIILGPDAEVELSP